MLSYHFKHAITTFVWHIVSLQSYNILFIYLTVYTFYVFANNNNDLIIFSCFQLGIDIKPVELEPKLYFPAIEEMLLSVSKIIFIFQLSLFLLLSMH